MDDLPPGLCPESGDVHNPEAGRKGSPICLPRGVGVAGFQHLRHGCSSGVKAVSLGVAAPHSADDIPTTGVGWVGVHRKEVAATVVVDVHHREGREGPEGQVTDGGPYRRGVHIGKVGEMKVDGTHVRFLLTSLGHDETSGDTLVSKVVEEGDSIAVTAVPTEVDTGPFQPLDHKPTGLGLPRLARGDVR
jgi:hypothetical protein